MPSWSYAQVLDESADNVQTLEPDTICDCIGAVCPAAIEYSSTYTDCAMPETMGAAPDPTRTTARLYLLNGYGVPEGVRDEVGVLDAVLDDEGVVEAVLALETVGVSVRAPVCVLLGVDAGVCDDDPDGELDPVPAGVIVDDRVDALVTVTAPVCVALPVIAEVEDGEAVLDEELVEVASEVPDVEGIAPTVSEGVPDCVDSGVALLLAVAVAEEVDAWVADTVGGGVKVAVTDDDAVAEGVSVLAAVFDAVRGGVMDTAAVPLGETETDAVLLTDDVEDFVGDPVDVGVAVAVAEQDV